jgi:hypothetical protein
MFLLLFRRAWPGRISYDLRSQRKGDELESWSQMTPRHSMIIFTLPLAA